MIWGLCMVLGIVVGEDSPIRPDEVVVLYPTAARLDERGEHWVCPIHGRVFEPEEGSIKRKAALGAMRRLLRLEKEAEESTIFKSRAGAFLVDNESGKQIGVRIAGRTLTCDESDAGGHFVGEFRIPAGLARNALRDGGRIEVEAVTRTDDTRRFVGSIHLVPPHGVSVISDIDDTIKISQVTDKKALLVNTFLREFQPAPGMAALYATWAEQGVTFHCLTSSPWQLYEPLEEFRRRCGFPRGAYHMKRFRLKDSTALDLFASPEAGKLPVIESLLAEFPQRTFILVGDSGERDPEIYGAVARKYPDRIAGIFIRNVTGETREAAHFRVAFSDVPSDRWRLFVDPAEIQQAAFGLVP